MLIGVCFSRGTNGFTIHVSRDKVNWHLVVTGSLSNVYSLGADIPLEKFPVITTHPKSRYVRFTATSFYGLGAGLQYITWEGQG